MIRHEEFNKILQLIDAGILSSERGILNHVDSLSPLVDIESFSYIINGNPSTSNHTIDMNLLSIINYINELNTLQNLRIGKNDYQIKWQIKFTGLIINIEDTLINKVRIDSINLKTIDSINEYLLNEFNNLKEFVQLPTLAKSQNLNSTIDLKDLEKLTYYYNMLEEDYTDLVKTTNWDFQYAISLYYEKG